MSEKNRENPGLVYDPEDVPEDLSDEDQIRYWETHDVTEEYLAKVEEAPEDERPHPRARPINVRFDDHTLGRLRNLADRRGVGYQTLLKQFVTERLYEEEKREAILSASSTEEAQENRTPLPPAEKKEPTKTRDWQSEAYDFVKANKSVIEDEDLDFIVSSRVLNDATTLLLEISNAIKAASKKEKFPAARLNRMMKGYTRLKDFVDAAFAVHEEKFGLPESNETEEQEDQPKHEQLEDEGVQQKERTDTVTYIENYRKAKAGVAALSKGTG